MPSTEIPAPPDPELAVCLNSVSLGVIELCYSYSYVIVIGLSDLGGQSGLYIQSYEAASIVSIKGYSVTKAFWYKVRIPTSPRFLSLFGRFGAGRPIDAPQRRPPTRRHRGVQHNLPEIRFRV